MKTVGELIDALGGHRKLAAALGVPSGTVSAWKSRGAIPARAWPGLVARARKNDLFDLSLDMLADLHGAAPPADRAKPPAEGSSRNARVRLTVDAGLLAEAVELGLEVERVAEAALREHLRVEKDRRWQAEHADVIEWYNEHIERDGIFGEEWRSF